MKIIYWYFHAEQNICGAYTSKKALADSTGINIDTIKYQFTRMKRTSYEKNGHHVEKIELNTSKRKK